jgi:hypothetical protein
MTLVDWMNIVVEGDAVEVVAVDSVVEVLSVVVVVRLVVASVVD